MEDDKEVQKLVERDITSIIEKNRMKLFLYLRSASQNRSEL